jgi:outer membrane receptor for ferrienterochelin and colicin
MTMLLLAGLVLVWSGVAAAEGAPQNEPASQQAQPTGDVPATGDVIVVTASKREEQLLNAPATMTVITEDAIANAPSHNLMDLMRVVPGVNVSQMSARDINITSRAPTGSLENSTLVLLDGRSVYQDFLGFVMWDFLPIDPGQIKQIEVIRGPASAVWGSNALTGVINVITKSPREMVGRSLSIQFGQVDRTRRGADFDGGGLFAIHATEAVAPTDRFAFKVSAGLLAQEAFLRPTGAVPNAQGTSYPSFTNRGTSQPKLDARADYDFPDRRRKLLLAGGIAGTEGIIHTGLGPLDVQGGSTFKYGRITYHQDRFKLQAFVNSLNGEAPLLLQRDENNLRPNHTFENQVYDVEASNLSLLGTNHLLSYGANFRENRFDLSLAPRGTRRGEGGAYVQDEMFLSERVRWIVGTRFDVFGVIDKGVFSPRTTLLVKPQPKHTIRLSFNRAFRVPSFLNSFIDLRFLTPAPLEAGGVFQVLSIAEGNPDLREEAVTAYEAAYVAALGPTTLGAAAYINRSRDHISFAQTHSYTSANPPPGWPGTPEELDNAAARGAGVPFRYTYLNFNRLTTRGLELSFDSQLRRSTTVFANYTWQSTPAAEGFSALELNVPPAHHVNAGISYNGSRHFASTAISYQDRAYWQDVLDASYHGITEPYVLVNAGAGIRSADETMTIAVRITNLLNRSIQQHVFGDVIKRAVTGEVRLAF